ncbi:MAG: hypothetical protein IH830_02755 [Planctomycetes bacterium]|nr:hypothetical protein [Planctomycetota bacterium]
MKTKMFDCVAIKRRGAQRVRQLIAATSPQEQLAFWQKQTEQLRRRRQESQTSHRAGQRGSEQTLQDG